jgi:hypothetical protein
MMLSLRAAKGLATLLLLADQVSSDINGGAHNPESAFLGSLLSYSGDGIRTEWLQLFHELWRGYRGSVSFCFGNSEAGAYKVLQDSLPTPLPSGKPESDSICQDVASIAVFLCKRQEAIEYYQVCSCAVSPQILKKRTLVGFEKSYGFLYGAILARHMHVAQKSMYLKTWASRYIAQLTEVSVHEYSLTPQYIQ